MNLISFILIIFVVVFSCEASISYKGHDISSLALLESQGLSYSGLDGATTPLETILKRGGFNMARLRVWVNPSGGTYGLDYNIKLAKRLLAAGLGIYIDLHYSDTWADPGHQTAPSGWPVNNIDSLVNTIQNYTNNIVSTFRQQSVPIDIISIGNEITNGLLWPTGKPPNFGNISRLLHAASLGAKAGGSPKIMVHLDDGWDYSKQQWFYGSLVSPFSSSDYDIQGISFYPFYNTKATLASLNSSVTQMARAYGKDIIVAETNWPFNCTGGPTLSERNIPTSAAGQTEWIQKIAQIVSGIPNGHGKGIFYWEPAWINNANLGSGCRDNLIFDTANRNPHAARASVNMFQNI